MKKDFYQVSLKLILRNRKNEVLILNAVDNGTYSGFYDLPGGRINENEFKTTLPDILNREVLEEVGVVKYKLNPKPVAFGRHLIEKKYSSLKMSVPVLYIFFEATYLKGNIKISFEHKNYKWVKLDKIKLSKYFKSGILEGIKMYLGK